MNLRKLVKAGHVELMWQPPTEDLIDALADQLLAAVRRKKVKRVVIDGLAGFQRLTIAQETSDRRGEGETSFNFAIVLNSLDRREEAIPYADHALGLFQATDSPHAQTARRLLADWRAPR